MQSIGFPILNYAPLKPSHVFLKEMANSEWTWMERTWGIEACLTHIFTSQRIVTLRHRWPGMRILWVCGVCEHQPMNTQGKETVCGWFLYTECLAADFPTFSVGSSFENHWRLFNARSHFQRSSLFQKGCDFQIYWVSLSTLPPLVNQIPSNARLYSGSSACAWMEFAFSASGGPDSARPRWCQSHLLFLDMVYLSAPPLYFLKVI